MSMRNRKSIRISSNEIPRSTESTFQKNEFSIQYPNLPSYTVST